MSLEGLKNDYQNGELVDFLVPGEEDGRVRHAYIRGIVSKHLVYYYIIEPLFYDIWDSEWSCYPLPTTHISPFGKKQFSCLTPKAYGAKVSDEAFERGFRYGF